MRGSLALVGSGEYLPEMLELERSLIRDGEANGKEPSFVQIPTAAGRESRDRIRYWESLGSAQAERLGVKPLFLPIFDRDHANDLSLATQISDSSLVYMSGGDPHYLANTLRGTKVLEAIVENWQSGGSLAGCSAGAMVLSPTIPNFRLSRSEPTVGFSLIPDIRVIPHFNKFFRWIPESAAKILLDAPGDSILLGIDELTALVQRSYDEEWSVYGQESVHILKGLPLEQLGHGQRIRLESKDARGN